jgi:uncharacterized protein (DUF1697 family)
LENMFYACGYRWDCCSGRTEIQEMKTYISILRGINVSGQRKILMSDLQTLYVDLGFDNVITYIQSGNVIFQHTENVTDKDVSEKIEQAISEKFSFEVPVIVRSVEEIKNILERNSFINQGLDEEKLHVTFLADFPEKQLISSMDQYNFSPDKFIITGKDVFLYCLGGYGKTKLSNTFFEQKLKVKASTRNWRTINKLFEIAASRK